MQPMVLTWPGGEDAFGLGLGHLRALQTELKTAPEDLLRRFMLGSYYVDDILAVLRQGLIGGGMAPEVAKAKVLQLAETYPLGRFRPLCERIMQAALYGDEGDPVGEPGEPGTPGPGSSPAFTGLAQ